jgi:hypothetical protein
VPAYCKPTKLAFAILKDVFGLTFTTKASVLEVLTMIAVPFVVFVTLFIILTVS